MSKGKKIISISLDERLVDRLKLHTLRKNISVSKFISDWLEGTVCDETATEEFIKGKK